MIQQFSAMLRERLLAWKKKSTTGSLPKNILYFRDGVSESQYSQVREEEVNKINAVFTELKAPILGSWLLPARNDITLDFIRILQEGIMGSKAISRQVG
jgi:hypothetical protein